MENYPVFVTSKLALLFCTNCSDYTIRDNPELFGNTLIGRFRSISQVLYVSVPMTVTTKPP